MMAVMSGNVEVAQTLIAEHKADVRGQIRDTNTVIGFDAGCTPLHACMSINPHEDMQALLLNSGADLNALSKSGL
jgi:hypothetical protein